MNRKDIENKVSACKENLRSYVLANPLVSLLIALLVGVVIHALSRWLLPPLIIAAAVGALFWLYSGSEED